MRSDHSRPGLIGISPQGMHLQFQKLLGNPENPSYMPESFAGFIEPMTFQQRLVNTILFSRDYDFLGWIFLPLMFNFFDFINVESYRNFLMNMDLLFLNSHFVTHNSQVNILDEGL